MIENKEKIRYKLEKHLWPDEVEKQNQERKFKIYIILSIVISLLLGYLLGTGFTKANILNSGVDAKFYSMLNTLSNDWYFSKEDEDVQTHLLDKAYYGMSTSKEDPHTTYMSSEEVQEFMKSINMNFVGIGVQIFNAGDYCMVKKVFKNSPAEKAGVLEGDIFNKVDGKSVNKISTEDLAKMVRGEANSSVNIEFIRAGKIVNFDIKREELNATSYGRMIDKETGYLEMYQFGSTTANEVYSYLSSMSEQGMKKLIIDLRDNGGGYLDSLEHVLNYLLPKNTVVMQQEYIDGSKELSKTTGGQLENIQKIVILINEGTASASEVMTLALRENRSDVVVVGTKSYGKGTVQVTKRFNDNSALKYTTSKWLSPSGLWINKIGIEPDIIVEAPKIIKEQIIKLDENENIEVDSVSLSVSYMQKGLQFLGYEIDRIDGYFSQKTLNELNKFRKENNLEESKILDENTLKAIVSSVSRKWSLDNTSDPQYMKAMEIVNE